LQPRYPLITSTIFLSDGFTIRSLPATMAKSYGFNVGTSADALLGTGWSLTLAGTAEPMVAWNPAGAVWFEAWPLMSFHAVFCCAEFGAAPG
jgi:hypothetical protein